VALSRTTRIVSAAWLLFWGLLVATAVQDFVRDGGTALWQPVLWELSSGVTATFLMLLQLRLTRRYDHLIATPWRWFRIQLFSIPFNCLAFVPMVFGIRHAVYAMLGETYTHREWLELLLYESIKVSLFFATFVVARFSLLSFQEMLDERARAEQAKHLLKQAQLFRLTQQMQPHFLFNALNTISSLMQTDVARADAVLLQLADVLRASLDLSEQYEVLLSSELRLARGYAALMAERFVDRVEINWQVDDATLACKVPVMSLQPLLENVFKHTVEQRRHMTRITVSATLMQGQLVLRVEDDSGTLGPVINGIGIGIGIVNLQARLEALYPQGARFSLSQLTPAGVRAEVSLPCTC
jgi:two-component system LytT family sensor kinase